jgi:Tfp pilus assembly protein PilX
MTHRVVSSRDDRRSRQRGLSLIIVLVALVVMSFAAIALLRSSDTSTLVSGNLAFQRTALQSGDAGIEAAIEWLEANAGGAVLHDDDAANGYFSTTADACDLTGTRTPSNARDDADWVDVDPEDDPTSECHMRARQVLRAGIADGFEVRYAINRVCNSTGDPNNVFASDGKSPMTCSQVGGGTSEGSTRSGGSYNNLPLTGETQTYYRITVRIAGPRNTVRYVQAFVVL